jgi:hypothetical protein
MNIDVQIENWTTSFEIFSVDKVLSHESGQTAGLQGTSVFFWPLSMTLTIVI